MNKVLFSHNSDNWRTPSSIYNYFINKLGSFDPCPYLSDFDGLNIDWKELNFVNPPYSQLKKWVEKSIIECDKGNLVYLLIPARTDTKAFKLLYDYGCVFTFIIGRLKFNDSKSAPFPSMLVFLLGDHRSIIKIMDKNYFENRL